MCVNKPEQSSKQKHQKKLKTHKNQLHYVMSCYVIGKLQFSENNFHNITCEIRSKEDFSEPPISESIRLRRNRYRKEQRRIRIAINNSFTSRIDVPRLWGSSSRRS